ncbi:hypothetical protein GCM10007304_49660 [Rhodococcoides trifolii]|uniref:EthD domain-containing protein n=2 Tax=Rhodococcoides trifolii TaxID=908250 RepID=A0A917G9M4_9NOCA|nr:hypothetical protein GCM10007304_49660 [Rhodococcus trifolii]
MQHDRFAARGARPLLVTDTTATERIAMSDITEQVRTIALIGRKPGMSFEQFDRYWRDEHAPLAAKVPGVVRYVQRHVVPQDGAGEPDNGFGIDGLAVLDYESAAAMDAGWASEDGQRALADTANFIGKHFVVVLDDHVIVGDS